MLSLLLVKGVEEVIYTAPATVAGSGLDAVSYTVADQYGDTANGSASVQLDAGPKLSAVTPAVVEQGQSTEIGSVAAGLAGDPLIIRQTGGAGVVSLQLVGGVEEVIYTAPTTVAASGFNMVSYAVSDAHHDATSRGSSSIPVASGSGALIVGTAGGAVNAGAGNSVIDGRAGNETIQGGGGQDVVFAGAKDTVTLLNGNDAIFGTSYDTIRAGSGQDTLAVGNHDRITLGGGNDTVSMGIYDTVKVGAGQDVFAYNELGGGDSITGFLASKDLLDFSPLSSSLSVSNAPLSGGVVAADSIAWAYLGTGAMAYVNDTNSALSTGALGLMDVVLNGVSSGLSASNFKG